MKFKKVPVEIEAIQFNGNNTEDINSFVGKSLSCGLGLDGKCSEIIIPTLEGNMTAVLGDWIIKGVKGEFYPCKPDIFKMTYEPSSTVRVMNASEKFVAHIQEHLCDGEHVICKVCNKTLDEIAQEDRSWIDQSEKSVGKVFCYGCKFRKNNINTDYKDLCEKHTIHIIDYLGEGDCPIPCATVNKNNDCKDFEEIEW